MQVAVIIPCLNEEQTVEKVVRSCVEHLPQAMVYVFDNGSTDRTAELATRAGATVVHSPLKGKGHALRHAFRVLDPDYFVLLDGDGTYPVAEAPRLIALARDCNYEMVMGARLDLGRREAFRPLHYAGNRLLTWLVRVLFRYPVKDLLTGYRVFSRHFVQEVRLVSRGFELETELTVRAIAQDLAFVEVAIPYRERPMGSHSKLSTFRDGWLILSTILRLWRSFRPLSFFCLSSVLFAATATLAPERWASPFISSAVLFFGLGFYLQSRLDFERLRIHPRGPALSLNENEKQPRRSA